MRYVPPFESVNELLRPPRREPARGAGKEAVQAFVRALLIGMEIDEDWYRRRYRDISEAIAAGTFGSGRQHFISHGYFEGRVPFPIRVDPDWYLAQYPEIAEAIASGTVESPRKHFDEHG